MYFIKCFYYVPIKVRLNGTYKDIRGSFQDISKTVKIFKYLWKNVIKICLYREKKTIMKYIPCLRISKYVFSKMCLKYVCPKKSKCIGK